MKRRTLLKSLLALFGLGTAKVAATPRSSDVWRGVVKPDEWICERVKIGDKWHDMPLVEQSLVEESEKRRSEAIHRMRMRPIENNTVEFAKLGIHYWPHQGS